MMPHWQNHSSSYSKAQLPIGMQGCSHDPQLMATHQREVLD
jgi:hypothetical protein